MQRNKPCDREDLVVKWRSPEYQSGRESFTLNECADELEAALACEGEEETPGYPLPPGIQALRDREDADIIALTDKIDFRAVEKRLQESLANTAQPTGIPLREALGYMWAHAKADPAMPRQYVDAVGELFKS